MEEREIIGEPFKYRGIWFFVHKNEYGKYIITEWSTGYAFYGTTNKARIKAAIDIVFDKIGADKINKEIKRKLKIFGVANKEARIVTVNLPESYISDVESLLFISSLSYSEYIRRAVQYKIELEMEETRLRWKNESLEREGFIRIPGYNGDKYFQTRRLE